MEFFSQRFYALCPNCYEMGTLGFKIVRLSHQEGLNSGYHIGPDFLSIPQIWFFCRPPSASDFLRWRRLGFKIDKYCRMRSGTIILSLSWVLVNIWDRMVVEITVKPRPYTKTGCCAWSCTNPNCGIVRERREKFLERRWRAPCFSSPRDRALCFKLPVTTVLCFNSLLRPSSSFHFFLRRTSSLLKGISTLATYISSILRAVTRIRSQLEAAFCSFESFQFFQSTSESVSVHQLASEEGFCFSKSLRRARRQEKIFVSGCPWWRFSLPPHLKVRLTASTWLWGKPIVSVSPRRISCFELPAKREPCFISRPKRSPYISSTLQSPTRISLPLEAAPCISLTQSCSHCISSPLRRAYSFTWPLKRDTCFQVASKCSLLGSKEGFLLQLTTS